MFTIDEEEEDHLEDGSPIHFDMSPINGSRSLRA
jgi:hypothetical protein